MRVIEDYVSVTYVCSQYLYTYQDMGFGYSSASQSLVHHSLAHHL